MLVALPRKIREACIAKPCHRETSAGRDFPASAEHSDREPSIRGHHSQFFRDRSGIIQLTVKNCQSCSIPGEGEVTLDLVTGITAMSTRSPPPRILRDRACKGWNESREPFHPPPRPPRGPIAHSVRGSSRKRQWCGLPATKLHTWFSGYPMGHADLGRLRARSRFINN